NAQLIFGAPGQDGVVVWQAGSGNTTGSPTSVEIKAGTLKAGGDGLTALLGPLGTADTLDAGATLDVAGVNTFIRHLDGSGTITNSSSLTTVTLDGGTFAGTITGPLALEIGAAITETLTGTSNYSGKTTIDAGAIFGLGDGGTTGSVGS